MGNKGDLLMLKVVENKLKEYLIEAHKTLPQTKGSKKTLASIVRKYIEERHSGSFRIELLEGFCNIGWVQQNMRQIDKTIGIDKSTKPNLWYLT
tara:strand:- start:234 stop:515 length:282 start_codon:yes stop_codon:yes gene_type:complete